MVLSLEVGLMNNVETHNSGDPYKVIDNIEHAKADNLDVIVGPEWSLTHSPNILPYEEFKSKSEGEMLDALFDTDSSLTYAPRDAKKILEKQLSDGTLKFGYGGLYPLRKFIERTGNLPQAYTKTKRIHFNGEAALKVVNVPRVPYSKREYVRLLDTIRRQSIDSDLLVIPGTAMYYDHNLNLHNVAPILHDGKVLKSFHKLSDGGSSSFSLNGALKLYPDPYEGSSLEAYGINPNIYFRGLKVGVEICADSGILKNDYRINDLDLQVLVSCGIIESLPATKPSGYISVVDGCKDVSLSVSRRGRELKPERRDMYMDIFRLKYNIR